MAIDREFWKKEFTKNNFPVWTCSKCNTGIFEIFGNKFHSFNDGATEISMSEDCFDYEWVSLRFCSVLKCNNKTCQETAVLSGRGFVVQDYDMVDGKYEFNYTEYFQPEYCYPPPAIFRIPKNTPEEITIEILQSFSIFFSQPNSAGNKIRTSIEMLLDQQRVKKTRISKKSRKREKLNLHDRILEYGKKNAELSANILAIKWIGNTASHTRSLELDDVFDAFDLLHHVLTEIYDNRAIHIAKITKKRNKNKR